MSRQSDMAIEPQRSGTRSPQDDLEEIDREISSRRRRRAVLNKLVLPAFVVPLVAMIIAWISGFGTVQLNLLGITTIAGVFGSFYSLGPKLDDEITDLEFERRKILADPDESGSSRQRQIGDHGTGMDRGII